MKTNVKTKETVVTHGGGQSVNLPAIKQLRRTVMANMLFEDQFYEDGQSSADRIKSLVKQVKFEDAAQIAIDAREKMKLRHVPLLIVRELLRNHSGRKVGDLVARVIQRPDELGELMALYWKDGKDQSLSAQLKQGLARALKKFTEYQLAKYNRDGDVKLRDILFLSHAKPNGEEQAALFKRLAENTLVTPDTWEVQLSGGADKKATFERLIAENKLGALALLRNLRGMSEAGVPESTIRTALATMKAERVLPFRFLTAAKHAPKLEPELDAAMLRCLSQYEKLPGKTIIIVDVSGSMYGGKVSGKSEVDRAHAACCVAALAREICENVSIYATAGSDGARTHKTQLVPARHGMALIEAIYGLCRPLGGGGIFLKQVMDYVFEKEKTADRIIVLTDEQDCGITENDKAAKANAFGTYNYLVNVGAYKNGINFGKWTAIDGWSEAILEFVRENEVQTASN